MIKVDFSKNTGRLKPMHAVNNGPVYKFSVDQRITNMHFFKDAGIPYVRNHDAAFYSAYGGEHTVDVHAIFPDFNADPYDAASYDFVLTDEYLKVIDFAGCKTFYRLGTKIEHWCKKYGTLPPPDFKKWAVICEHIIRHYTEGWADGFNYDIEYWEIWNEPDLDPDHSTHKRNWGGTAAEFFELYKVASSHLKEKFPHLKIGGPAVCSINNTDWIQSFLKAIGDSPLDFFSWHRYAENPDKMKRDILRAREVLDSSGRQNTESILNEWNYVNGWEGDAWVYSLKMEKSLKGASFVAGTMCVGHNTPLDMLMYYDARPCAMNGLFNTDLVCEALKGYYPFWMYNKLYTLEYSAECVSDDDLVYACAAASNEGKGAIMLTYFDDDEKEKSKEVEISIEGIDNSVARTVEIYCLDENNDARLVRKERLSNDNTTLYLEMSLFSTYLLKID